MPGYNVKIFHYATGTQIRVYNQVIHYEDKDKDECIDDEFNDFKSLENNPLIDSVVDCEDDSSEHSMYCSYSRTKQSVIGIARANEWDLFVTFTFDPKKIDSTDLSLISKKTTTFLNNLKKRHCPNLAYLLVPELHSDGKKYHLHGLFRNYTLPLKDSGIVKSGKKIYNIPEWKFGFSTVSYVSDSGACSYYISKYIVKEMFNDCQKYKKRYWASRNLFRPKDVVEELILDPDSLKEFIISLDFKNVKTESCSESGLIVTYYEI